MRSKILFFKKNMKVVDGNIYKLKYSFRREILTGITFLPEKIQPHDIAQSCLTLYICLFKIKTNYELEFSRYLVKHRHSHIAGGGLVAKSYDPQAPLSISYSYQHIFYHLIFSVVLFFNCSIAHKKIKLPWPLQSHLPLH